MALIMARRLGWDPTIVHDTAAWIAPPEMLTAARGQALAASIRDAKHRLPESLSTYNPGLNGELQAVPA